MLPTAFPQANATFKAPEDLSESQVASVPAFTGRIASGSLDGAQVVVVAWQPDATEIELIRAGKPIYLSCIGGLPPHLLTMDFDQAIRPA